MVENKMQQMTASSGITNSSSSKKSSPCAGTASKQANNLLQKPVVPSKSTQNTTKTNSSTNKQLVNVHSGSSIEFENNQATKSNSNSTSDDVSQCVLPSILNINENNTRRTTIGDTLNASIIITDGNENDLFIDKINELSLKNEQQKTMVKNYEKELKRLRATTIGKNFTV